MRYWGRWGYSSLGHLFANYIKKNKNYQKNLRIQPDRNLMKNKRFMKWTVLILLLIGCIQMVSATISVPSVKVDPSGSLIPGTPVTVQFRIENSGLFPSGGEIRLFTELDDPNWTYTIIVNGVENLRPVTGGSTLSLSGFELSYKPSDEVSVRGILEGAAPSSITNITIVKIEEFDSNNNVVFTTVVTERGQINPTNSRTQIGIYQNGVWYLDYNGNGKWDIGIDKVYNFGAPGWTPVVGDWNGDGKVEIGVTNGQQWYLDSDGNGAWDNGIDFAYSFGAPGWTPVVGKWS